MARSTVDCRALELPMGVCRSRYRPLSAVIFAAVISAGWQSDALEKPVQDAKPLLILAPEAFHEVLEGYRRHKQERRPVEIVSLERILRETSGCDDPERVKRYLFQQWKAGKVGYALLVGDAD